jgi:1-acyl-sn-glycerol-3-phosphate acyltransferase
LHKGHTGPARLALRTGAPLVPIALIGTREIQPPGARVPRPFRPCEIRIGHPVDTGHYRDRADERLVLRQLTDELMFEIRELSGQDYVDEYATRAPDALPSQPTAVVGNGNGGRDLAGAVAATGRLPSAAAS